MKNKILLLVSAFVVLTFAACIKGGKTGLLVPKDAAMVFHMDLNSLSSKLSWDEVKQTAWFQEAQKKADTLAKSLLSNPENSGIDTKGSLVFFINRNAVNGYVAFEGKLTDAAKFTSFIQQIDNGKIKVEKDGDYNFATNADGKDAALYFNDKMFVFVADASEMNKMQKGGQGFSQKYSLDSLKLIAKSTFNLKGKDLLDADERFAKLINDKADMHYWINSGSLYGNMLGGMMNMMKFNTLLEGNISAGKVNFENGKIALDQKQYYNKELEKLFNKYSGKELSSDVLSKLPDQNVLMAFAMNYSPEGLKEFLKLLGVDGMANAALAQTGITIDDFIKANKGEIAFALNDFTVKQSPASIQLDDGEVVPYQKDKTEMKFIFGTSVNDKASFQKLIDVINTQMKKQPSLSGDSAFSALKYKLEDKWFAFGSSNAEVDAFLAGNKKPVYADLFKGHHGGGYMDLQNLITKVNQSQKDTSGKKMIEISAAFWKNANMTWDIKGSESVTKGEVNLIDANTNALKQLNKYIDQLYLARPKQVSDFNMDFDKVPEADSANILQ